VTFACGITLTQEHIGHTITSKILPLISLLQITMPRPLIIFKSGSINSDWLLPRLEEYFEIKPWQHDKKYTDQHLLWHCCEQDAVGWPGPCIFEKFWDQYVDQTSLLVDNQLHLRLKSWVRFNESIWWQHLGYHQLIAQPGGDKFFLMLMNLIKKHRDALFEHVTPWLDDSWYSYYEKGHQIHSDLDAEPFSHSNWQRHCNIEWYNRTQFSLVAESQVSTRVWISEKTYKPMAFGHAFLIWGSPGTLQFIHKQGFQTFDHAIDESYDTIIPQQQRLAAIIKQIEFLHEEFKNTNRLFQDSESLKRIQHNYDLFYDPAICEKLFLEELVEPIKKFIDEQI